MMFPSKISRVSAFIGAILSGSAAYAADSPTAGAAPESSLVIVQPESGKTYNLMGTFLTVKIGESDTSGRLTIVECLMPPSEGIPYHAHMNEDMSYYIINGEIQFQDFRGVRTIPAGGYVYAAMGTFHSLKNISNEPARMVVVYNPGYNESFFKRMDGTPNLSGNNSVEGINTAKKAGQSQGVVLKPSPLP